GETVAAGRSVAAQEDPWTRAPDRGAWPTRHVDRLRVELGVRDRHDVAVVRPAVRLAPQAVEDGELILEEIRALLDRREGQPQLAVLQVVPARTEPDLEPSTAHLVDRRDHLGQVPRV